MNVNIDLNDSNFFLYMAKFYENKSCATIDEFYEDLNIVMHLKKLFTRYQVNKELRERLILNHILSLFNIFHPIAVIKLLLYKMDEKHYSYIKTVLVYLNRCPDIISVRGKTIDMTKIEIDELLYRRLEKC